MTILKVKDKNATFFKKNIYKYMHFLDALKYLDVTLIVQVWQKIQ